MSSSYRGLYAYPWDLAEQDPDSSAEDLHRSGIDTLCVASSYHAGKFLRPHGASGHVYFPEDGTVHCRVRPERCGRIKPCESSLVAAGDPFGTYASLKGIAVTAWTVLLHNTRLGMLHPDIVVRNAFGDAYPYSLCPCHPDVQAYAIAFCVDIADRYPVRGLVLETPGWIPGIGRRCVHQRCHPAGRWRFDGRQPNDGIRANARADVTGDGALASR